MHPSLDLRRMSRANTRFNSGKPIFKILIVGPPKAGKTAFTNFIVDNPDVSLEYAPTKGVRIVDCDTSEVVVEGEGVDASVLLWDVGGDGRWRECWPAIKADVHGVVLVADPERHGGDALLPWYTEFSSGLESMKQVLLVLMTHGERTNDGVIADFVPHHKMASCRLIICSAEHDGGEIQREFSSYLRDVISRFVVDDNKENDDDN